ncbi:hypothetical protein HPB47_000408 [Ixodes persulcatus]|uniref:Uncharacterized protein n=1 Tax=Ixodes persulcatus TaxID=34615 RepID=A0AC60PRU0_IXOPE|nr:hypothetical protein HPB47_000408 [Ixodes persulcatus]
MPYADLTKTELSKVDVMIRKAYTQALRLSEEFFSFDCDSQPLHSILLLKPRLSLTWSGDTSPSHRSPATCTLCIMREEGRREPKPYTNAMATNQPPHIRTRPLIPA